MGTAASFSGTESRQRRKVHGGSQDARSVPRRWDASPRPGTQHLVLVPPAAIEFREPTRARAVVRARLRTRLPEVVRHLGAALTHGAGRPDGAVLAGLVLEFRVELGAHQDR